MLLVSVVAYGQGSGALAVAEPQKLSVKRSGETLQALKLSLKPGYHCNGDKPTEEWMIPLKLTWQSTALETVSVAYPKPKLEKFEFADQPIAVLDGEFEVVTKFKRAANAMPGPAVLSGKLRYQACNNKMCLPPKTIDIKVPLLIE
jgi:hypothetical protein